MRVSGGTLTGVTVAAKGPKITGRLGSARTTWTANRTLAPSTTYTVTAVASGPGGQTTVTSRFTTLKPTRTLAIADVTPQRNEQVGVGMPIIVTFDRAVRNRGAVERALTVTSDEPSEGAWRWMSDRQVVYRTKEYWRSRQKVTFTARLAGVRTGKEAYGVVDTKMSFQIGPEQIATVNVKKHAMVVRHDGKRVRTMPISAGNGTTREYTTTNGVHLTMAKTNPEIMISPGRGPGDPGYYEEVVNHAVRISNSGEYVHSAPWSVGSQGRANVSHGCVNASPSDARWFYEHTRRGDVVEVTDTDRELEWNNGWGFWQLSWRQWIKGSALRH